MEIQEYADCLRKEKINLKESEVITIAISADINGDHRIDYEEFMLFFHSVLKMIRFQEIVQEQYN